MDMEIQNSLTELYGELNGERGHDTAVLQEWAERCKGDPQAVPLLKEIGRLLFLLGGEETERLTHETMEKTLREQDKALSDARRLFRLGDARRALEVLAPCLKEADCFSLSDDCLWMDFQSFLEGLVFQDYFADEIGDREIRRHPMHPGELFFTYACLLVELGRLEEARETLEKLMVFDPVCPKYLFELTDVYKRSGGIQDAFSTALWALQCVSNDPDAARCYRDLGYCLAETGAYAEAAALYQLSIRFQPSPQAEAELRWIAEKSGTPVAGFGEAELQRRCEELGIPVGLSETVKRNMELLDSIDLRK